MIDGLAKKYIDPLWEKMAAPLVKAEFSPNQVTAMGLGLIIVTSALYLWHQNHWVFGFTLAFSFAFDALDGAVARQRGMASKVGGYFDAMVDRYQELVVLCAIAWVNDLWIVALLAFSGAMITSYAKARTAIEIPISNEAWPDFFERLERVIYLCALLILAGVLDSHAILSIGFWLYAGLCHLTAIQRARRAVGLLRSAEQE